jgi:hypothetical protein
VYNDIRLWLGAKGNEKKRMSEEGFQFRYFQSAGIGARHQHQQFFKENKMKKLITICAAIVLWGSGYAMAGTWTTLDNPMATGVNGTVVNGIDGSNLVGWYMNASGTHGYLYDGTTWTTLDTPGSKGTAVNGIDGSNLVGYYWDNNKGYVFLYNGSTWTNLDVPVAIENVRGIDGSNIVGRYHDASGEHQGYIYNIDTHSFNTIDKLGATDISLNGIDGSNIVGWYKDASGSHGYLYDGTTWTTLDAPGATSTIVWGIEGSNLVGQYWADGYHGFLYDGTTWTTLDAPGAIPGSIGTCAYDISGSYIVGEYEDASGFRHGFVYEIPEPATLLLLGFGAVILRKR